VIPAYQELAIRIRDAVPDIESTMQRALLAWPQAQCVSEGFNVYVDSVALNLHSFYSGIERLFELIARHVDEDVPTSPTWHRQLLQQMAVERPEIRPAVISQDNAQALDEFRRCRHLVRNAYAMELTPAKMTGLTNTLTHVWSRLHAEFLAFADFLEDLAQIDQSE